MLPSFAGRLVTWRLLHKHATCKKILHLDLKFSRLLNELEIVLHTLYVIELLEHRQSKHKLVEREALLGGMPVHRLHVAGERRVGTQRYLRQHNVAHHNGGTVRILGGEHQGGLEFLRIAIKAIVGELVGNGSGVVGVGVGHVDKSFESCNLFSNV